MAEIMDVSRHQGTINWEKVKASGKVDGVMIRAMGNSATGRPSAPYTDPQFARNYAECKRLGIPCGVYGYFKAVNREQADKELAYFKKLLTGRSFELPVAVDIEDEVQKPLGKAALTDLTAYMLSTVESWGVYALLYTGLWFGSTFLYMGGAALKPYDVWLARYPKDQRKAKPEDKPKTAFAFGMWQYTSTASVPGIFTCTFIVHSSPGSKRESPSFSWVICGLIAPISSGCCTLSSDIWSLSRYCPSGTGVISGSSPFQTRALPPSWIIRFWWITNISRPLRSSSNSAPLSSRDE